MSVGITVEHPVPHVHTQNGLAESLIKRLQYIARPLIMRTKLPVTVWGHAILHAATLIRLRPSADHKHTPYQLAIDAGYLSDPHNAKSQTGYVFTYGDTAISWRSQKQTLVATSSNHAEVIALHEASKECRWLRSVTQHIQGTSGLPTDKNPTILYEDNAACVTQMKEGYVKSDRTKHIPPKFFSFTQELERNKEVDIQYIRSSENVADLFTKALSTSVFKKHVRSIGMRHLRDI
ncbi:unnamed protein product [Trifolium pratense]|uniref:Uncharacterized protein n=1 Tax=Trifolium pratense TaxID=57577 RepID=A0ACB0JTI4_TRIPR|nr:unnamed protein product [Trifolium pratense]